MARERPAYQSIFSILRPAVGPSSSHTLGPLLCARDFRTRIERALRRGAAASLRVELYGSLAGTGRHLISFDAAVRAMWRTGQDLRTAYRETARGGLAVEGV